MKHALQFEGIHSSIIIGISSNFRFMIFVDILSDFLCYINHKVIGTLYLYFFYGISIKSMYHDDR